MTERKLTRDDLRKAAEKYKNWGRWGPDDELGTLNHTRPEDIVAAARLVRKGKVISLALNFDNHGPQGAKSKYPALGRINPLHTMLRTGTDAYAGVLDKRGIRAADDQNPRGPRQLAEVAAHGSPLDRRLAHVTPVVPPGRPSSARVAASLTAVVPGPGVAFRDVRPPTLAPARTPAQ